MPRPFKTIRPVMMNLSIEEDLYARMKLELYSDLEQKVPHGAQSKMINKMLRSHFRSVDAKKAYEKRMGGAPLGTLKEQEGHSDGE